MYKIIFFFCTLGLINAVKSQDSLKNILKNNIHDPKRDSAGNTTNPSLVSFGDGTAIDATTAPVIMPSPNSAALTNIISDNVDLYTGKTNVNLPLYTLESGNISLPISLQANVNAHKVNDIGTWVGLGWNLNAGGVITRVMKNLPDEFLGNTISPSYQMPGWGYLNIRGNGQNVDLSYFDAPNPDINILKNIIAKGNWNARTNAPDRGWDLQPDEFYFNFGNYSGKFLFDQDGNINLIPKANFNITPLFQVINGVNKITGFTILTEDGFKYEFGNVGYNNYNNAPVEETKMTVQNSSMLYTYRAVAVTAANVVVEADGIPLTSFYTANNQTYFYWVYERYPYLMGAIPGHPCNIPGNNPILAGCFEDFESIHTNETTEYFSYPSSWMLNKITSAKGDEIIFTYSSGTTISYQNDRSFSASVPTLIDNIMRFQSSINGGLTVNPNGNRFMPVFMSAISPTWDSYRKIYRLPAKQNFTVSKATIELKFKKLLSISTSVNSKIEFASNTAREDLIGDQRLDYMTIRDRNNVAIKKINFNYSILHTTESESAHEQFTYKVYPSRYNNTGSGDFISMVSYFYFSDIISEPLVYQTKTWNVPPEFRKRMFLSAVQEEANGVSLPAYSFNYHNGKLPYRTSTEQDLFGFANTNVSRHPFPNDGHTSQMLFYWYTFPYLPPSSISIAPLRIGNALARPILFFNPVNYSALYGGTKNADLAKMHIGALNKIVYPTGGYKEFEFEFSGNTVAWNGIRVKQSREYESATANPIIKNYAYGNFVNTDNLLNSEYNYPTNNYTMGEAGLMNQSNFYYALTRKFFSGGRVNPENSTRGAAGGYSFAEISQPNNGKYRVEFHTALDPGHADITNETYNVSCFFNPQVSPVLFKYPFPAKSSLDWKRGLLKNETTFSQSGLKIKYEEFSYAPNPAIYGQKDIQGLLVSKYKLWTLSPYSVPGCEQITSHWLANLYGKTVYTSAWYPPVKKISRIYDQNGINYSESIQEFDYRKYTYTNKEYLLPYLQKDIKGSRNEQTVSYSKFPFDYNSSNIYDPFVVAISNLKTKNIFNAKVEQFAYKQDQNGNNKKYIGGILNKYHSDKPLVKEVFKLRTNGTLNAFVESNTNTGWFAFDPNYRSEVNFPLYDVNGRILEQHKTNDIKESYIWSYNKMYPVAKVANANNSEIAFSSFEADEGGANMSINPADIINDPAGAFSGRRYYRLRYPGAWFPQEPITINLNSQGKDYKLSFWHKEPLQNHPPLVVRYFNGNVEIITPFAPNIKTRNGWNYSEYLIPASFTGTLTIIKGHSFNTTYIDEVRFYPALSQMSTYTFDPLIGMTSETDVNGKTVYYEYDGLNRLKFVRNEDKDIVKRICYNYASLVVPCN